MTLKAKRRLALTVAMCGATMVLADMQAAAQTTPAAPPPAAPCTRKFGDPLPLGYPWITSDDYPQSALRQELSGTVKFRVNVTALGRAENVEILGVEGAPDFAAATVRVLTRRARFKPAVRNCQPVPGEYEGVLRWAVAQ